MIDSYQALPGGVGVSHLRVYDSLSPDGVRGGSAHVHLSCTEAYVVVAGRGTLQTLSSQGFQELALHEHQVVWFTPGIIHRLVTEGELEIVIVMQNGGLPESGDCILTFPEEYLKDKERYRAAVELPPIDQGREVVDAAAKARKDLSITGFVNLRERMEREGLAPLHEFYRDAAALVDDNRDDWRALWEEGAVRATATTGSALDALEVGDLSYLAEAAVHEAEVRPGSPRAGMCGRIISFDVPEGRP